MAINLKKIARDLQQSDEDIRILALTTIAQIQPSSIEQVQDLDKMCMTLETLSQGQENDTVFLARKGLNHLKSIRARVKGADTVPAPWAAPKGGPRPARPRADLLPLLKPDADPMILATALQELGQVGEPSDVETIKSFLDHDDPRVRGNAVEALEHLADEKILTELLSPLFQDSNNRVRGNIAKALGKIGYPRILEIVREMMSAGNISMAESAVWAMSFIKGPEMVQLLLGGLKHPYEGIRLRAVQGLAQHKDPGSIKALQAMFADMDVTVAEAARRAVLSINEGKATPYEQEIVDLAAVKTDEPEPVAETEPPPEEAAPAPKPVEQKVMKVEDLQAAAKAMLADDSYVKVPKLDGLTPDQLKEMHQNQFKTLGDHLFELMKKGQLNHEMLNKFYYDILKFQEFLKKHHEKEAEKSSGGLFSALKQSLKEGLAMKSPAVARLEESIATSMLELAKKALHLLKEDQIKFPKDKQFSTVIAEIEKKLATPPAPAPTHGLPPKKP